MPALPQKIRMGLIELRTDIGPVYVRPSFWERIYLLWTFRHFRSLPQLVLNRHQRQLIDRLSRTALASRNESISRTSIIGAVENVCLMRDWKTEAAATTSKLVEMSTTSAAFAAPQAVGCEGIPIRSNRAAYKRTNIGRSRQRGKLQYISAPRQGSAKQSEATEESPEPADSATSKRRRRNQLGWTFVAACSAALPGILLYLREGRLVPSRPATQVAIESHQFASGTVPAPAAAPQEKVQPSMPPAPRKLAAVIALIPRSPAVSSPELKSRQHKTVIVTQPSAAAVNSAPEDRLQVAEAPESGFSYPVAPNPTLTGRVNLKAVIGADGTVMEVDVLSGNRLLAGAAVRAVRHWRYRPRELNGHAVEAETNIAISFVGDDAVSISFPAAH
jgi:outer membrane biosynthesis protein TonB